MSKRLLTDEQELQIIQACQEGQTAKSVAAAYGVAPSTLSTVLRKHGVKVHFGRPQHHTLNHNAFDTVTPESAYWMGFLFADGRVHWSSPGAAIVRLQLSIKDRKHVEKFRDFLGASHKINEAVHRNNFGVHNEGVVHSAAITVSSVQLAGALTRRGLVEKQNRVPTRDVSGSRDFWRGAVDGDGTVRIATDGKGYRYASIMLYGQIPLLEKFQSFLMKNKIIANITDTTSAIFQVRLMGAGALAATKLLYEDATVALDRKLEAAREVIQHGK